LDASHAGDEPERLSKGAACASPTSGGRTIPISRYRYSHVPSGGLATSLVAAVTDDGNLDPLRTWTVLLAGEKPGGHGERCVAVGTLDMALWDTAAKIVGATSLDQDPRRIETAVGRLSSGDQLAVDAMNRYDAGAALAAAAALERFGLWWFEDICDPLDSSDPASRLDGASGFTPTYPRRRSRRQARGCR
jgi:L-alanine-DL-glutamate epimerase-like enolase superfamily enzyme